MTHDAGRGVDVDGCGGGGRWGEERVGDGGVDARGRGG